MDIDRYIAQNQPTWDRLASVTKDARKRIRRLEPTQVDELIALYERTSSHLSYVRTYYQDPALIGRLTLVVGDARSLIYGTKSRSTRSFARFFTHLFPAAVWNSRRFILIATALTFVPALAMGAWIANSDRALDATAPPALREAYVEEDFEAYYSSENAGAFSTRVLINNIQVSFFAFAAGIVFCAGTAAILMYNGANVGLAAGLFYAAGQEGRFWGLILPHGLLELSAVVIAGAAGIRLGWAIISPGDRSRSEALAEEGRLSATVVMGLIVAFIIAGIIEGFVTPSALPTGARVGIGVLVEAAFILYIVTFGRRAAAQGITGGIRDHKV